MVYTKTRLENASEFPFQYSGVNDADVAALLGFPTTKYPRASAHPRLLTYTLRLCLASPFRIDHRDNASPARSRHICGTNGNQVVLSSFLLF
jgi:hypothetical protein